MLDIDECHEAAEFLGLGDRRQSERRFSGAFRAIDFDDAATGKSSDSQRAVDHDVPGGNRLDLRNGGVAEAADGLAAIVFFDLLESEVEVLEAGCGRLVVG